MVKMKAERLEKFSKEEIIKFYNVDNQKALGFNRRDEWPLVFCSQYAIIIDSSLTTYEVIATILSNIKRCG